MKIAVIDIETTGLDPKKHQILEIYGYQLDLEGQGWDKRHIFHAHIQYKEIIGDPYALIMNAALIKKIQRGSDDSIIKPNAPFGHPGLVRVHLQNWIFNCLDKQKNGKITFAGKNVAKFDIPFILNFLKMDWNETPINHRTLDPAILYMRPNDVDVPGLDECMRRCGGFWDETKAHTAKYDAECVGQILRQHFYKMREKKNV